MTTSSRFKSVTNSTGAALVTTAVAVGDGNERATRVIKRTFSAADIGTTAGKTQHALGCIIEVLQTGPNISGTNQPGINTLNLSGASWKQVAAGGGRPIGYKRLDNLVKRGAANIADGIANLEYFFYPTDNTIRVFDSGATAAGAPDADINLAAGDYCEVELTFGQS